MIPQEIKTGWLDTELISLTNQYNKENRKILLNLAKESIQHGLDTGRPLAVDIKQFPPELADRCATFVTLQKKGQLRGCIGILEAVRPLAQDICENAFSAAFRDPRFPPLEENELELLDIHLSILSSPEPMTFTSEEDLISQIRPGVDGLILEESSRRGTFLPSVWESLPSARQFLRQLKKKAGLPEDFWSDTIKVSRYTTEYIE